MGDRPDQLDLARADAYGRSFGDVYDRWYDQVTDAEATAEFVAARHPDPTLPVLKACLEECKTADPPDPQVTERLRNMLDLFRTMDDWYQEIMGLPSSQLRRLVGMRQKVRKVLRFGA